MNKTLLQIKVEIIKEQILEDPELENELKAYLNVMEEFGDVSPPTYLKEKLDTIDILAQARLNGQNN